MSDLNIRVDVDAHDDYDVELSGLEGLHDCTNGHPRCYWYLENSSYCPVCRGLGEETSIELDVWDSRPLHSRKTA